MFLRFFFYFIGKTVYSVSVLPANEKGDQKKFENLVDRLTTVSVSYTHLDVYKRQHYYQRFICFWRKSHCKYSVWCDRSAYQTWRCRKMTKNTKKGTFMIKKWNRRQRLVLWLVLSLIFLACLLYTSRCV